MVTDETIAVWWIGALVIAVVVVMVVAVLLELIVRTAKRIRASVSDIWTGGKRIAGNTVTIALLEQTNVEAGALLGAAGRIAHSCKRIEAATAAMRRTTR